MDLPPDIFATTGPVVLFPVRHHSPTAARLVRQLIERLRPASVLIEGPSDFNERLDELALPHKLPVAIYSYVRRPDGVRRGAYYPFCVYSPEWQAFRAGRGAGAAVRFIDLPYGDMAEDDRTNLYADADLRRSEYVRTLCSKLGVDTFDAVWDVLFELDATLTPETYLERAHRFCAQTRWVEERSRPVDRQREAFMAEQIRSARDAFPGVTVVVTGGYHSLALHARLRCVGDGDLLDPPSFLPPVTHEDERGIALTPYSYERLDALTGYNAGMPNPGFYHRLWEDRAEGRPLAHRRLLSDVAVSLRQRKQAVSSADLIAAETCATALSQLRGHDEVWRNDLVDGMTGALIKHELGAGGDHPLLDAIHEVLRGSARGALADGAQQPPLVIDLHRQLAEHDLVAAPAGRTIELDLTVAADLARSRVLHRIRLLGIAGYERTGGTDFAGRGDLSKLWETWQARWSPEFEASAVEAARYGSALSEAAAARLAEEAAKIDRSAERGAALLLDASLAGLSVAASDLFERVRGLVRRDGDFLSVTAALGHLLYLYRYDDTLGTAGRGDIGATLVEMFVRGLWLLDVLGQSIDPDGRTVLGVSRLLETFESCEHAPGLNRVEFVQVLSRVAHDPTQGAAIRGASSGALWVLGEADVDRVRADLKLFSDPDRLGDFLTGLFAIARELVQRKRELILAIDAALNGYSDEQFLTALPSLRLAFTYFTPREKHHMAASLITPEAAADETPVAALLVPPEQAAAAMAHEARIFAALERYGLRGGGR